jgi:hypothetical protein
MGPNRFSFESAPFNLNLTIVAIVNPRKFLYCYCEPRRVEAISHLLPEIASLVCVASQRRSLAKTFGKFIFNLFV